MLHLHACRCLLDHRPRQYTVHDCNTLCNFAELVVRHVERACLVSKQSPLAGPIPSVVAGPRCLRLGYASPGEGSSGSMPVTPGIMRRNSERVAFSDTGEQDSILYKVMPTHAVRTGVVCDYQAMLLVVAPASLRSLQCGSVKMAGTVLSTVTGPKCMRLVLSAEECSAAAQL